MTARYEIGLSSSMDVVATAATKRAAMAIARTYLPITAEEEPWVRDAQAPSGAPEAWFWRNGRWTVLIWAD